MNSAVIGGVVVVMIVIIVSIASKKKTKWNTSGSNKEECNEYGCFKIFTEMDNWIDGTIKKGEWFSPSGYTGYESMPEVNDNIPFASLNAIEKYLRSNSSGAPSNYIKELIELWAPGELGY